jgi:hypothetical protein
MCVFCAAIPATLALGARAHTRQKEEARRVDALGEGAEQPKIPAGPFTALVVTGLVITSVIYHSQYGG